MSPIVTDFESTLETGLIEAIQPIRQFVVATAIYHLFETGLIDVLDSDAPVAIDALAAQLSMNEAKLVGFVKYLRNEGYLQETAGAVRLSVKGKSLKPYRGWYTMLIGGYAETYLQMGKKLALDSGWATRNAAKVAVGSCCISHYDAIPLSKALMESAPGACNRLLDLGCGNGQYLVEFCKSLPNIQAWGAEPDLGGYQEAVNLIEKHGLASRVQVSHAGAIEFLESESDFKPDFIVLGFVLHEVLGQSGRSAVVEFLQKIVRKFPAINIIVIEVDNRIDESSFMRHGLSMAYYNPYYLLHYFTNQLLIKDQDWLSIFADAGLALIDKKTTCQNVDSTKLEIGYLLKTQPV